MATSKYPGIGLREKLEVSIPGRYQSCPPEGFVGHEELGKVVEYLSIESIRNSGEVDFDARIKEGMLELGFLEESKGPIKKLLRFRRKDETGLQPSINVIYTFNESAAIARVTVRDMAA
jgi:hypothetical protein